MLPLFLLLLVPQNHASREAVGEPSSRAVIRYAKRHREFREETAPSTAMALDLLTLAERTGKPVYRSRAEQAMRAFAAGLERFPAAFPSLARAALRLQGGAESGTAHPAGEAAAAASDAMEAEARDVVAAAARWTGPADRAGWAPFEVRLSLRPGWHVNANPASLGFLIPTEIHGEVRGVAYPAGESFQSQAPRE